jgi:hypothetical protein
MPELNFRKDKIMEIQNKYDFDASGITLEVAKEMQQIKEIAIADGIFMKTPNGKQTNLTEKQWLQVRTKTFRKWYGDWQNDQKNASKILDKNGEPKVVYHGTNTTFTVFDKEQTSVYNHFGQANYFTDIKSIAEDFSKENRMYKEGDNLVANIFEVYLNVKNPYNLDQKITDKEIAEIKQFVRKNNDDFWFKRFVNNDSFIGVSSRKFNIAVKNVPKQWDDAIGWNNVNPNHINRDDLTDLKNWSLKYNQNGDWKEGELTRFDVYRILTDNQNTISSKKSFSRFLQAKGYDGIIAESTGSGLSNDADSRLQKIFVISESTQIKSATANIGFFNSEDTNILNEPEMEYQLKSKNIMETNFEKQKKAILDYYFSEGTLRIYDILDAFGIETDGNVEHKIHDNLEKHKNDYLITKHDRFHDDNYGKQKQRELNEIIGKTIEDISNIRNQFKKLNHLSETVWSYFTNTASVGDVLNALMLPINNIRNSQEMATDCKKILERHGKDSYLTEKMIEIEIEEGDGIIWEISKKCAQELVDYKQSLEHDLAKIEELNLQKNAIVNYFNEVGDVNEVVKAFDLYSGFSDATENVLKSYAKKWHADMPQDIEKQIRDGLADEIRGKIVDFFSDPPAFNSRTFTGVVDRYGEKISAGDIIHDPEKAFPTDDTVDWIVYYDKGLGEFRIMSTKDETHDTQLSAIDTDTCIKLGTVEEKLELVEIDLSGYDFKAHPEPKKNQQTQNSFVNQLNFVEIVVGNTITIGDKKLTAEQKRELAVKKYLEVPNVINNNRAALAVLTLNEKGELEKEFRYPKEKQTLNITAKPESTKIKTTKQKIS